RVSPVGRERGRPSGRSLFSPQRGKIMAKKNVAATEANVAADNQPAALNGSNIHPSTLLIGETEYQLGDFVGKAFEASGLSAEEWNSLPEDEVHKRIDAVITELGGQSALTPDDQPPNQTESGTLVECAVLHDCVYGKHDDII